MNFKALFVHMPRTAGTFLSNYFSASGGVYIHGHKSVSEIGKPGDIFIFSFIRNPWDWYVSRYFFEKGFKDIPSFKEYIKEINDQWLIDIFNKYCFKDGKYLIDYMGRFEDIPKSIKDIHTFSGINPKISYEIFCKGNNENRRNNTTHDHYTKYYDDELIKIISKKDKIIIDKFSYSFGR